MYISRESGRRQALFVALIALVAAAALIVVSADHAGAAGKAKQLKYVGTSPEAPGTKLIVEGPVSKKAKKGAWPSQVTVRYERFQYATLQPGSRRM